MNRDSPIPQNFTKLLWLKILIGEQWGWFKMWKRSLIVRYLFPPKGLVCRWLVWLLLWLVRGRAWAETGTYYQISQTQVELLSLFRVHERLPSFSWNTWKIGEALLINALSLSLSTSDITTSRGTRVGRSFVIVIGIQWIRNMKPDDEGRRKERRRAMQPTKRREWRPRTA